MLERDRAVVEHVLHESRENDVKFICLCFSEILGNLKGFALTLEELESAMMRGMGFDGPSIEGFARSDECDLYALPDTHTFNIFPWDTRTNEVARRLGDFRTQGDEPFEGTCYVGPDTAPITKP
jgi:glutamine synthetase